MCSFFFLFFCPTERPTFTRGKRGRAMGNEKHFMGMALHLYSLATDTANIFSSRLHAVFFERISLSATDIYHSILIRTSQERYVLNTKAQGHQSWKVSPWGVSGLGTKTFPPNTRQVHCCSIYKMADEIQQPAKKRRKTEKTGSDLDDKLESKQQSAKKSGEIEKLNSLYTIFWPSSQQFSYKSCILKLFLQVKMWIVATTLKKRWGKHSKLNFPPIFSIFGIFAKIWKVEIHVVSLLSVSTPLASIYD